MTDVATENSADRHDMATCGRCGSINFVDTPIHNRRSTLRDCARCNRTMGFPIWQPNELENLTTSNTKIMEKTMTSDTKSNAATTTPGSTTTDTTIADTPVTAATTNENVISITSTTTPAITPVLVDEIVAEHAACMAAANDALDHALRCGELLTALKLTVAYGEWEKWMETHLPFAARTARKYMQLAANRDRLLEERSRGAVLSLREAYRIIAPSKDVSDDPKERPQVSTEDFGKVIPPPGASLGFVRRFVDRVEVLHIEPSPSDEYFFVTFEDLKFGDDNSFVEGYKRALRGDCIFGKHFNRYVPAFVADSERVELPDVEPLGFNHFLFDSYEDYFSKEYLSFGQETNSRANSPEEMPPNFPSTDAS